MENYTEIFAGLNDSQALWLRYFLDAEDAATFMRPTAAAVKAGAKPGWGYVCKRALAERIRWFLNDLGLDQDSLKAKLVELLHSRETKFHIVPGKIDQALLPAGVKIMGEFVREKATKDGMILEDTTLVAIDVEAKELQRKALDMALKVQGLYAPEKVEVSGMEALLKAVADKSKNPLDD